MTSSDYPSPDSSSSESALPDYDLDASQGAGQDQRSEFRLSARAMAHIELESPEPDLATPGPDILSCYTTDLSATGVRLISKLKLPLGALLPVTIELARGDSSERFPLMMEVVWCRAQGSASWNVGLKILESDDTALVEWLDLVARAMEDQD
ncbi:MAG: pilus assembly protein PilZ [Alteromonadaceae bacterium]|nr:pilus assembly protein PilZ [Alteromonadaceae bacterium]MBH87428.1 pilus assembly protein PilZ [Alteromonadaceae bacterium]|tara:strand:- start:625 stop:1080 length:456 start_codon:yes stop_codon:yes gene_type:complete